MIVDAVVGFFVGVLSWMVGLLPDGDPIEWEGVSGIWTGYAQLNTWLPLTEVLACVVVMLGIQLSIYGYLAAKQVRSWLPF